MDENLNLLKSQGNEYFKMGSYESALETYLQCLDMMLVDSKDEKDEQSAYKEVLDATKEEAREAVEAGRIHNETPLVRIRVQLERAKGAGDAAREIGDDEKGDGAAGRHALRHAVDEPNAHPKRKELAIE